MAPKAKANIGAAKSAARRQPSPSARGASAARRQPPPSAPGASASVQAESQEPKEEPLPLGRTVSSSVIDCFRRFDRNGEGKIARDDLIEVIKKIAPGFDCEKIFNAMDYKKDSVIDYSEFVDWIYEVGDYRTDGSDAQTLVAMAPNVESPQEQLDRCLQELAECETVLSLNPEEIWFEPGDALGMRFGRGDERRANFVMKVESTGVAARAGVQPGWQISEVAWLGQRREVTGTTFVPDLVMEGQRHGSVCVKILSNDALERQRAAEFRLPELLAAVDIAQKRQANASQPLEYSAPKPSPTPAALSEFESKNEETASQTQADLPLDAAAALAKYQEQNTSFAPSYEELQEAMGKESWTKWRKGMSPQEWFEHMGIASVEQDNPYKLLAVSADASQEELKIAFRDRAREFHPDKFPDDPESAGKRFDCIKKAYDRVRTEHARAKTDAQLGVTDFFTLYAGEDREGRRRMMAQTCLMIKDDPDALPREAGVDEELKRQGSSVVKYHHYKLPFKIPNGRLAIADIDALYCLTDAFPGCTFMLAEWRPGDCHILRPGDSDSGESAILKQENGFFCDLRPGMSYHLLVQEKG